MATQVLLHVPDPWRALGEIGRVLAPDGVVSITEIDWGTITVESTDRKLSRRFAQLACDELRNGLIVRELPWRLRDLGFHRIRIHPEIEVAQAPDAFHHWFIEPSMSHFTSIGAFSKADADWFLGDLRERAALGRYFCSRTYYSFLASRSAEWCAGRIESGSGEEPWRFAAGSPMALTLEQVSDRLDRLPGSRFHAKVLVVAALSLLFDTLDHVVTGFVLASLRTIWHFDVKTIGLISAIGLCGYLVGSFFCGFIADRIGRKKIILFTLILYSLFSALRGLSGNVPTLAVLNFVTLIFIGAESSTVPPYLAELWPTRMRGKLIGWMMAFFGLGIALAPVWALLIIPGLGWRWALLLTAPFALIGGIVRSTIPESPRWLIRTGKAAEAELVLRHIEAEVEKEVGAPLPDPAVRGTLDVVATRPRLRPRDLLSPGYRRLTLMLWVLWFAEFGVLYAFQTFVPTILSSEGYSIVNSFRYSVAIYGGVIPGYVLGGQLVEWLDRKYSILLSFAAIGTFGTLFGLSKTPLQIMVFGGLTAFSLALGSTSIYTYTPELYPTEIRATGVGIASAWGRVGAVMLLLGFGSFFVQRGKSLLFTISDLVLVLASIAVFCFGPLTRGQPLEETARGIQLKPPPFPHKEDEAGRNY